MSWVLNKEKFPIIFLRISSRHGWKFYDSVCLHYRTMVAFHVIVVYVLQHPSRFTLACMFSATLVELVSQLVRSVSAFFFCSLFRYFVSFLRTVVLEFYDLPISFSYWSLFPSILSHFSIRSFIKRDCFFLLRNKYVGMFYLNTSVYWFFITSLGSDFQHFYKYRDRDLSLIDQQK